ncbi:HAD family hydrolase [Planosporangium sp. 12N6]|uniref:HAD family hydrolase n=1 Tax=Planosporangium spinosum TaxID=3402278 RepID=UPI003CF7D953
MPKGLLLDFYGTVVEDDDAVMDAIAEQVAAGASTPVTGPAVSEAWGREFATVADGPPFRSLRESAVASLATVMAEVGCAGDPASLCAAQFAYWRSPPLRPGTREFLSRVTVPVCVVSDVDRDDLAAATAYHGLTFTAVVTSEDVGVYKPHLAMFTRGLAALGLGAGEVLHVGDSLTADVGEAHAAGIRAAGQPPGAGGAGQRAGHVRGHEPGRVGFRPRGSVAAVLNDTYPTDQDTCRPASAVSRYRSSSRSGLSRSSRRSRSRPRLVILVWAWWLA